MLLLRGLGLSAACAAVGAALWAGVTYATGWEFALIGIITGGLAGFGMGMGNKGRGGAAAGVLAALVTFAAYFAGKYAGVQLMVNDYLAEQSAAAMSMSDEDAMDALAYEVWEEYDADALPMGFEDEESGWPTEVWETAKERWSGMSGAERETYKTELEAMAAAELEGMEEAKPILGVIAFLLSFGLFDLVCLVGAMGCGYKGGSYCAAGAMEEASGSAESATASTAGFTGLAPAQKEHEMPGTTEMACTSAAAQAPPTSRPGAGAGPGKGSAGRSSPDEFLNGRRTLKPLGSEKATENAGIFSRLGKKEAKDDGLPTFGGKRDEAA